MSPFEPSGGSSPSSQVIAEMMRLLQSGQFIDAIKVYRQATKQGLKESKDFVDRLQEELKKGNISAAGITIDLSQAQPAAVTGRKGFGCGTILLVFLLGLIGGLVLSIKFPATVYLLRQIVEF